MRVEHIDWGNGDERIGHVARHNVTRDEVEDVLYNRASMARRVREGAIAVYGRTMAGRYLIVFVLPKPAHTVFVLTARDMTNVERRHYQR